MIYKIARSYIDLPHNVLLLFVVELCLSLVHVAFILILNILGKNLNLKLSRNYITVS